MCCIKINPTTHNSTNVCPEKNKRFETTPPTQGDGGSVFIIYLSTVLHYAVQVFCPPFGDLPNGSISKNMTGVQPQRSQSHYVKQELPLQTADRQSSECI